MHRIHLLAGLLLVVAPIFASSASAGRAAAAPLCAYHEGNTQNGRTVTATFHVVSDQCEVSFVSIAQYWYGNAIYDEATGTFNASDQRYVLSVQLPCGSSSETDLTLGRPSLFPPSEFDIGADVYPQICDAPPATTTTTTPGTQSSSTQSNAATPSGGTTSGGGSTGSSGNGGGGGGGQASAPAASSSPGTTAGTSETSVASTPASTPAPRYATTIARIGTAPLHRGSMLFAIVSVANSGTRASTAGKLLITPPSNALITAATTTCTGVGVTDGVIICKVPSLRGGKATSVHIALRIRSGRTVLLFARAIGSSNGHSFSSEGSLLLPIATNPTTPLLRVGPARATNNRVSLQVSLTTHARLSFYTVDVNHHRTLIWTSTLAAGKRMLHLTVATRPVSLVAVARAGRTVTQTLVSPVRSVE